MSDDFSVTGYDPADLLGFDEDSVVAAGDSDLADAVPKPFAGLEYTGDLEDDAALELDALSQGFRDRKEREAERFELATNSDYWMCLAFATQAQHDAFLDQTGWRDLGHRYLDGRLLAKRLGLDLPPDPEWPNAHRDTTWDEFAMTVEENRNLGKEGEQ